MEYYILQCSISFEKSFSLPYFEYEHYKAFRLTNEQRIYFGIEKVEENWEEIEIREGTTGFFEGNVIKKWLFYRRTSNGFVNRNKHLEAEDIDIPMQVGIKYSSHGEPILVFSWGMGLEYHKILTWIPLIYPIMD